MESYRVLLMKVAIFMLHSYHNDTILLKMTKKRYKRFYSDTIFSND